MSFGVSEIRERAERLKRDVARERYEAKAGFKQRPDLAGVYATHSLLAEPDVLPTIQRALSEAEGEDRRRLRYLESWVGEQRVEAAVAPLEDEYRAWEATTGVRWNGGEIPFRRILQAIENEGDHAGRLELERRRAEKLEEAIPLQVDILHREREALAELGLGSLVEARERLTGINIRGLEREAVRVLTATEAAYEDRLAWLIRRRLDASAEAPDRSDVRWLRRMPWLDDHFGVNRVLETVRRDLATLGLPLEAGGRVQLDLAARPAKSSRSFCGALEVPRRVVLVVSGSGGHADCDALLHELGHALHFAYTDPGLPFEYRSLGDCTVTEAYAVLFELLMLQPAWLRRAADLRAAALEQYRTEAAFLKLYKLRRLAAKLLYEVELYDADLPGEMAERYAELVGGATRVSFDARTFLDDLDRGFWVARQLRAWMLGMILATRLRDRYDEDWYRNPAAGPTLGDLLAAGHREDARALAGRFGAERLSAETLLEEAERWLA